MAYNHILWVNEHALDGWSRPLESNPARAEAIGNAVLKVCLNPDFATTASGQKRITYHAVEQCSNGVNWADSLYGGQERVYLWKGNCLRMISELDTESLKIAQRLVEEEIDRRQPLPQATG